jgi:thioredoxin-like negative regulator of GroEL
MSTIITRLVILALVALVTYAAVQVVRRYISTQQHKALAAIPYPLLVSSDERQTEQTVESARRPIRILAFSSPDCHQCHQLQTPALHRVLKARGEQDIQVIDVDATTDPELVKTYHVLTVPSTVILDRGGQAHAVNYGFANTQRILQQVDELLATSETY